MRRKKITVFTGAGVSADSGLKTFRDSDGLWEHYHVTEVATPEAWTKDPHLVLEFYNLRRKQIIAAKPNPAHYSLAKLEQYFDVQIITQNIDDLHERAGSRNVLHLHGEIRKAQSTEHPELVYDITGWGLNSGDKCEKGFQLRPHVVWFGETVPNMPHACRLASQSDILIIVGTSLVVHPAAGLVHAAPIHCPKYIIDPNDVHIDRVKNLSVIREKAGEGVPMLVEQLINSIKALKP